MKQIDIPQPAEVTVCDTEGKPVIEDGGSVRVSFGRFVRTVLLHDAFVEGLDTLDATELRLTVKTKLDALKPSATRLVLEDDECRRLQKANRAIRPSPLFAMACIGFMRALNSAHAPTEENPKAEDAAEAN